MDRQDDEYGRWLRRSWRRITAPIRSKRTSLAQTGGMHSFNNIQKSLFERHQQLDLPRASACTEETLLKWYIEFEQFLLLHDLDGKPDCIWNCDESGFPLCPKSGKVLAPRGTKTVYRTCITTLVDISASGGIIPPFHIFSGERFSYNPLEGAVEGAYFGR